ncbi:hypothetical protein B0H13DRAFT_1606487 [Mycena leptocephala]|nr:hypothetical protein B0H13DRAFT_1606487 [Mycena leptocephala]
MQLRDSRRCYCNCSPHPPRSVRPGAALPSCLPSASSGVPASRNVSWLNQVLARGYPPLLTKRMLAAFDPEGPEYTRPEFEDTPPGKAFNKFTFIRGFIPVSYPETSPTVEYQHTTARAVARSRVYNTKYLMPERCWGPFQPLDPSQPHVYAWRNRLSRFTPPESDSQDADIALRSASSSRRYHGFHPSSIAPHLVVPDYTFLAAARYIMEANMPPLQHAGSASKQAAADVGLELSEVVDAMQSLELARMGGAPGFWDIWRPEKPEDDDDDNETPAPADNDKGKGKATDSNEFEGWDWAGVEGEWRRVVCWLDYRDLLSAHGRLRHRRAAETIRIFPMTLRVARYERPPRPPPGADPRALIWRLPIIHVEGESRGTDTDEDRGRVVEGTVRMIGDGAVRWSMTSSEATGADPEWVTESVQVGEIGSAVGIIGLWTGAEHSSTDPLGPCWAWKVAVA